MTKALFPRLRSYLRIASLLFFSSFSAACLSANVLEVALPTKNPLTLLYLAKFETEESDWRLIEELRSVLAFDFRAGGFFSLMPLAEGEAEFSKLPSSSYALRGEIARKKMRFSLFDASKGTWKRYPDIPFSGSLEKDRKELHKLADQIHRDLFGVEGIASCQILYSQRSPFLSLEERHSEIWISDADGANGKRLTSEKGYCLSPTFFPRSSSGAYLFVSFDGGQSKIYCAHLGGPEKELFLRLRGSQILPALSSDGRLLAFISDAAGRPDLFLQKLGPSGEKIGKPRQIFSAPRATQASPTFSPKGTQVAFVSDKDGSPRIYLLDLIDPQETKKVHPLLLTKRNRENTSPAWSPDGTKLAYSAKVDGLRQIWIYDFATGEETPLTTGEGMKENPSWAPDSLHLVYNTESEESCELFLINLRSPEPLRISQGNGLKRFPCWSRR